MKEVRLKFFRFRVNPSEAEDARLVGSKEIRLFVKRRAAALRNAEKKP